MNAAPKEGPKASLTDALAAERTFLAWIRTGLALMGFGFVVARFGLFLKQLELIQHVGPKPSFGVSVWFGTTLIVVGVFMNLFSAWHHYLLMQELGRGGTPPARPSTQAILIALFLALIGIAMAIYLLSTRRDALTGPTGGTMATIDNGIITIPGNHSVEETIEKLRAILASKGITLFALIDHSGEAEKVGMKMPPTKLLIFGSPKAGTPLMLAVPSIALDLPLKILVWEDAHGKTFLSYNRPSFLAERHGLPENLLPAIAAVEALVAKAAE